MWLKTPEFQNGLPWRKHGAPTALETPPSPTTSPRHHPATPPAPAPVSCSQSLPSHQARTGRPPSQVAAKAAVHPRVPCVRPGLKGNPREISKGNPRKIQRKPPKNRGKTSSLVFCFLFVRAPPLFLQNQQGKTKKVPFSKM